MPRITHPYPPLTDGVLWLRSPNPGDAEAVTAACQDPVIQQWIRVPVPYTLDSAKEWLASGPGSAADGTAINTLGFDRAGALMGSFGAPAFDWDNRVAEIGYWTAAEARGRGTAVRAVWLLRDWLMTYYEVRTFEILCHEENAPSRRVAEKAGWKDTGERRPHPRDPDATELVHCVYSWSSDS